MAKDKLCIHCSKPIHKKAKKCKHCGKLQYKPVTCKWCREKIPYDSLECPHCNTKLNVSIKKSRSGIFDRFIKWIVKPKSCNGTTMWIFTLAAALPVLCWLIIGESGLIHGTILGLTFATIGFLIAFMTMI